MGIKDYFIENLGIFTEEYLIALGNKGLYKRALKDIDKGIEVKYEIGEESIKVEIEDNTIELRQDENRCSCISRSTCKHILHAYLYLINNQREVFGIEERKSKEVNNEVLDFSYLTEFDYEALKGAKLNQYKKALRRLSLNFPYEVREGSVVVVTFDQNKVSFFPSKTIDGANCLCKSKDICSHKLEALAYYRAFKGIEDKIEKTLSYSKKELENFLKALLEMRSELYALLSIGIVRYDKLYLLEQLAIKLRRSNLANFEREVNRIITSLEKYREKSANFDLNYLKSIIIKLVEESLLLEKAISNREFSKVELIVGRFREEYLEIPNMVIESLGYEKWKVNGKVAETIFFKGGNEIYTLNNYATKFANELKWQGGLNFNILKNGSFQVTNPKTDINNRLSSSKDTRAKDMNKEIDINSIAELAHDNYKKLIEDLLVQDKHLYVLKVKRYLEGGFDYIKQEKLIKLVDQYDNMITGAISYRDDEELYIKKVEKLEKSVDAYPYLLCKIFTNDNSIQIYPLVAYKAGERLELRT